MSTEHENKRYRERSREFSLASLLVEYPSSELFQTLKTINRVAEKAAEQGFTEWLRIATTDPVDLEARYAALFELGKSRISLYETEHGRMRGMSKGNDLADISGFYLAFGLEIDRERSPEMLDQLAVELEFCAHLLFKLSLLQELEDQEGVSIVEEALAHFIEHHVGRYVSTVAGAPAVSGDPCYGPILTWCDTLIKGECEYLHVAPPVLDFFADNGERDDPNCSNLRLPVLQ
jgi:nitrate reductase assembly molybdenum cofactor insertion protein NarJ